MLQFFKTEKKEHPHGAALIVPQSASYFGHENKRSLAREGYQQNVIVYRAIREITNAVADITLMLKNGDDEVTDHPILDLLNRPNPMQGQDQFFENVFTDYLLFGEMFFVADRPKNPIELWPLLPLDMKVEQGRGGIPLRFVHCKNNKEKGFDVDPLTGISQVFYLKMYNPLDYWRGMSPLEAAALAADTHNAGMKWNYSLLKNSGRPSGVLKFKGAPSSETINRLTEFFKKRFQGENNAGEIPVLTDDAEWQAMDNTPRDMDFNNTLKETAKYIASAYGVPLPLIDNDASTFNNMEQAKERLWTDTVLPLFNKFLASFNVWLQNAYDTELYLECDLDSIPALENVRTRTFERALKAVEQGVLSPDEARVMIGYDPRGDMADSLYVNASKLPIELSGSGNE